jgi:hypothetical protein
MINKISNDSNHIFQIPISQLNVSKSYQQNEEQESKEEKEERESEDK